MQVFPRDGNPLMVTLPDEPGDYLLQYVDAAMNRVLAEAPIRATPPPATLSGPQAGIAGSTQSYDWTGPGSEGDWIGFYRPGNTANHGYDAVTGDVAVADGQPQVTLRLPPDPGRYELRYIAATGREVLARLPVEVTPAQASVQAATPGIAGAQAPANWTGPGYDGDWVGFYPPGNTANRGYEAITGAARSRMASRRCNCATRPSPGTYELRYVMELGRTVLAADGEVTPAEAALTPRPRCRVGKRDRMDRARLRWRLDRATPGNTATIPTRRPRFEVDGRGRLQPSDPGRSWISAPCGQAARSTRCEACGHRRSRDFGPARPTRMTGSGSTPRTATNNDSDHPAAR